MRVLQIQGLRALASILVVLFHAKFISGGFVGVDIFYVISGYLITGLLLRELDSTGRLNLAAFYQRRMKRLLPSSVFVLFSTALVGWFLLPTITRHDLGRDLFAASAYVSNYLFAWWQNDYQNLNATPSPFIHYWSLAVEEQFYLMWPLLMIALARKGRQWMLIGIALVTSLSLTLSIYQTRTAPIWAFYSLPTRAWELGIGALLLFIPTGRLTLRLLPWIAMGGLFIASSVFSNNTAFPGINALLPVLATAALIATIPVWPTFLNALSNNAVSQWLGKISYPLYLWHWPVLVLPSTALGRPLMVNERIACIALTVLLADLTNRFLEDPIRHTKISPKKIYARALSTTAISLVLAILISNSASTSIQIKGASPMKFDLTQVLAKPLIYSDGCHVNYGKDKSGTCTYAGTTSTTTIVLFGDSHAAQWFPVLEKIAINNHVKLISLTKSSCPAVDIPQPDRGGFNNLECKKWRENSIARIKTIHPLAVVISSYAYYTPRDSSVNQATWWRDGQQSLINSLGQFTQHLIYISDTPKPLRDIPSCLSAGIASACDATAKSTLTLLSGFQIIDPTPWLCTTICPAIVDSIVAYRDASHISVAMALHIAPELEAAFKAKGLFA
ncbi:MAG: acyltransferase [Streptomycetaceae bacterium]|nr:MAG: acyltransferase [Streptomycetaceae bacterium]